MYLSLLQRGRNVHITPSLTGLKFYLQPGAQSGALSEGRHLLCPREVYVHSQYYYITIFHFTMTAPREDITVFAGPNFRDRSILQRADLRWLNKKNVIPTSSTSSP